MSSVSDDEYVTLHGNLVKNIFSNHRVIDCDTTTAK
jgi:hypothetical protein